MTNVATQQDTVPVRGAGKKSTYAKNQLYSKPLPVGTASQGRSPYAKSQTWCDRFNEWTSWLYEKSTIDTPLYRGWYDSETCSVWMHDKGESYKLWTQGFFGKGNLSRSEPTWAVRRHAELDAKQRGQLTAEQMTQKRREERKMLKIERARAAVRAGIQLPDGIKALGGELSDSDSPDHVQWRGDEKAPEVKAGEARVKGLKHFSEELKLRSSSIPTDSDDVLDLTEFDNIEHFQLTMVEAFFLAGMLGCLEVYDTNGKLSIDALYHLCLQSQLPPLVTHRPRSSLYLRPDNPFLLSYVVYHHFRSLGWVVKSGTKFCVDYLLYKRGPVFSHAEFSVLVVPEYEYAGDASDSPFRPHHNEGEKSWVWFSMMNRVNTQVQKTLILAHVTIPSFASFAPYGLENTNGLITQLRRGAFSVKEVAIRRWVPARMKQ